jgi:hypothetical protein
MFKYYHYWAGIRLLTLIGTKLIEHLDLDGFDENVQVALYGLSIGFCSNIAESIQLSQLAKFVIAVTTVEESDGERRNYRTACRLLVEYFALLLQQFNQCFVEESMPDVVKKGAFSDKMMAFLPPITILTHWMANSPRFFENEEWNRRWAFGVSFLSDLWPEMGKFGNNLRLLKNNGLFQGIQVDSDGYIIPEIANSFGTSPVFEKMPLRYAINCSKNPDVIVRLFANWESVQSIANRGDYFTYQEKKGFIGKSDAMRNMVPEPEYFETPRLLPVPLKEIEDCINNRTKKLEEEQGKELADLIEMVSLFRI